MIRNILTTFCIIAGAVLIGAFSINYALTYFDGFGRLKIGGWEAYPLAGTFEADAYARARSAKRGDVALGRAEGLVFQAWRDDEGKPLNGACDYVVDGQLPESRLFTLYSVDYNLVPQKAAAQFPVELYSGNVVRNDEGKGLRIALSAHPRAGNWLATPLRGHYGLVLTLYDTPIATSTALQTLKMPTIRHVENGGRHCD